MASQPSKSAIWKELALKAQSGDKNAYNALLKDISNFTKNYLLGSLSSPDWADDITQEVLVSVHKSLKTYSSDRPFTPWLMAIIKFRRTDFLRRHYGSRQDRLVAIEDYEDAAVTNPDHAGEYKDIEGALAALPAKQREAFELLKVQGYSVKEVADQTGMSTSAVKVSVHRAIMKLKKTLG